MVPAEVKDSDKRYLRAMLLHPDPVLTAVELADEVGVTQQAAYSRLVELRDRGLARSKKVGSRAVVWWVTTTGRDAYADLSD